MIPRGPLQQLSDLDRTSPQFHPQLIDFLRGDEYREVVPSLRSDDLTWLVEYLDSVLHGISDPASVPFQESLHELSKICGVREVLPKSCTLSDSLLGCVYEGTFNGSKVRIRRVRMYPKGDPRKIRETFHQAAVKSKHLAHPNIVPLLGITIDPPRLISDWIAGGNLTEYITNNPEADRLRLVFTGTIPFSDKPPRAAMLAIIDGDRPSRPIHTALTDGLWALTQWCWDQDPHLRPPVLRISCSFGTPAWRRLIDRPLAADEFPGYRHVLRSR